MFVLAELKSTVKVHPSFFSKGLSDVSKFELNKKLANKVVHKGKRNLFKFTSRLDFYFALQLV